MKGKLNLDENPWWLSALSAVAILFGVLTLKSGGEVLFGGEAARQAAGDYVPFVLWFNFLAGALYVTAGAGIQLNRDWGKRLALFLAVATIAVFAAFGLHVLLGRPYETRTLGAMVVRSSFWVIVAGAVLKADPR